MIQIIIRFQINLKTAILLSDMPEIIQISYMLVVFLLFYVSPFSIIKSNKNNFYFNLIINLNFLLFFSILPLPITKYSLYILLVLFFIFIKNSFLTKKNIMEIKIDKIRIILMISSFFIISVQVISKLELGSQILIQILN